MTSLHHDLNLISQVEGWGTVTWGRESLGIGNLHRPRRVLVAAGRQTFERFHNLAIRWHQRARERRALLRLDRRMLNDIGLDRASAEAEARKPFWRP